MMPNPHKFKDEPLHIGHLVDQVSKGTGPAKEDVLLRAAQVVQTEPASSLYRAVIKKRDADVSLPQSGDMFSVAFKQCLDAAFLQEDDEAVKALVQCVDSRFGSISRALGGDLSAQQEVFAALQESGDYDRARAFGRVYLKRAAPRPAAIEKTHADPHAIRKHVEAFRSHLAGQLQKEKMV